MPFANLQEKLTYAVAKLSHSQQVLLQGLQNFENMATNPELKALLSEHVKGTQVAIETLPKVLDFLPDKSELVILPSDTANGLVKDATEFVQLSSSRPDLKDCAIADSVMKAEAFEVACLTGLIYGFEMFGSDDAVVLLENLVDVDDAMYTALEELIPNLA